MVRRSLLSLSILTLLLSVAPAWADIYTRASLLKFIDDATAGLDQATKAYEEDRALYDGVIAQTSAFGAPPYSEMKLGLRQMAQRVRSIQVNQGILGGKRSQVDLLFGPDEEILAGDRRYKDVRLMVRQMQSRADTLNADWETVRVLDKEFNGLVKKHGIKSRPASDYIREIDSRKDDNWKKVDDSRTKAKNVRQWAKKGGCDPATADSLDLLQKDVDAAWHPYKAEADRLKAPLKAKGLIYQGPGIPKVTALEEFEAASKDLKEKYSKFKNTYKEVEAKVREAKKLGKR